MGVDEIGEYNIKGLLFSGKWGWDETGSAHRGFNSVVKGGDNIKPTQTHIYRNKYSMLMAM